MTAATTATLLALFLAFLLSLAGQSGMAKMLCLATSILALLLSAQEYAAVTPWAIGMIIAVVLAWQRIRHRRMA
jgi:hypothetical protein